MGEEVVGSVLPQTKTEKRSRRTERKTKTEIYMHTNTFNYTKRDRHTDKLIVG